MNTSNTQLLAIDCNWSKKSDNILIFRVTDVFLRCRCFKRFTVRGGGAWRPISEEELWSLRSSIQQLATGSWHEHVSPQRRWDWRGVRQTSLRWRTIHVAVRCQCVYFRCVCCEQYIVCGGRRWRQLQFGLCGVLQSKLGQVDTTAHLHEHGTQLRRCVGRRCAGSCLYFVHANINLRPELTSTFKYFFNLQPFWKYHQ